MQTNQLLIRIIDWYNTTVDVPISRGCLKTLQRPVVLEAHIILRRTGRTGQHVQLPEIGIVLGHQLCGASASQPETFAEEDGAECIIVTTLIGVI